MIRGALLSHLDVAQVVLYAFFLFFAGLLWYLRQEDRREGYPLESEALGRQKERGFLFIPSPKVFRLADGSTVQAPRFDRDERPIKGTKVAPWPGAPAAAVPGAAWAAVEALTAEASPLIWLSSPL